MEINIHNSDKKSEKQLIKKKKKKKKKKKRNSQKDLDAKNFNKINNLNEPMSGQTIKDMNKKEEKNERLNKIAENIPESQSYQYFIDI